MQTGCTVSSKAVIAVQLNKEVDQQGEVGGET
jgi:hypothetical protein